MRFEVEIDDRLLADARDLSGIEEPSALVVAALVALIQHNAAQRLILLGGSDPDAEAPPRNRWNPDGSWGPSD